MLLSLALEYSETLTAMGQNTRLPGQQVPIPMATLSQSIFRITDEEIQRQGDEAFTLFKQELDDAIDDETMPLPNKQFKKIVKKLDAKVRSQLRLGLAELLTFEEVLYECERFEQRIEMLIEEKRVQNYS